MRLLTRWTIQQPLPDLPLTFFLLYVTCYVLSFNCYVPPPPHTAAVSGCIAPMGFDMLSSINGDLTGQQHFCRCHLALMNSPPSFKREAEEIGRRPHTTTRGRVVSDLLTEDERGGFHTWSDIMSSGSSHHDCILPNLLISRFIPLCLICAKLEIPILNPLFRSSATGGHF